MNNPEDLNHNHNTILSMSGNISGIEGTLQNDSDKNSFSDPSNSSSFMRSYNGISSSFLAGSANSSSSNNESFFMRYRRLQAAPTLLEHSFNCSMLSASSDKENTRLLTTRRLKNDVIKLSLLEGVSFLSPKNYYSESYNNGIYIE